MADESKQTESLPPGSKPVRERDLIDAARRHVLELPQPFSTAAGDDAKRMVPKQIGDYRIVRIIDSGGMGTVYEAEQLSLQRVVALKVIKPTVISAEARQRFELEKRVLGTLEHPGIAKIFEAGIFGASDAPQPYFSMEFVQGTNLGDYALKHTLTLEGRLQLFTKICEAIEHAHQKGIIHRDLKPQNVLVDATGQPKVVDFGVARVTDVEVQRTTMHTEIGQIVGTLPYMSPEQVSGDVESLDTRTDVYSLGVVLYELLAERLPYELSGKRLHEVAQIICEEEPRALTTIDHRLGGDIETVILKSLEKDRGRRYASVADFRRDIEHILRDESIEARPSTAWEVARKWVKRQPAIAALIGVGVVSALAILTAVSWSYLSVSSALIEVASERDAAKKASDGEREQRLLAEDRERLSYRRLYAADMLLARQCWQEGRIGQLLSLVHFHLPQAGREDLRGFEWFLAWKLSHAEWRNLPGHIDGASAICFSHDGKYLASAGWDGMVRLWNHTDGNEVGSVSGKSGRITAVAFPPSSSQLLATGGEDGLVRLWKTPFQGEPVTLVGHKSQVTDVCFSPDGRLVASSSFDGTIRVSEVKSGQLVERLTTNGMNRAFSLAFAPNGKQLAAAIELLGNGQTAYVVLFWDTSTWKAAPENLGYRSLIECIRYSPKGELLALASREGYVDIWDRKKVSDPEARSDFRLASHRGAVTSIAFNAAGDQIATVGWDSSIQVFQLGEKQPRVFYKGHAGWILAVAFSPDDQLLATAGRDGAIKLWKTHPPVDQVELRATDDTPGRPLQVRSTILGAAGTKYGMGFDSGNVAVLDAATGRQLAKWKGHPSSVLSVAVSPSGRMLATGSFVAGDPPVRPARLWDVATGQELAELRGHTDAVRFVCFSADERFLATCGDDNSVRIWELPSGRALHSFPFSGVDTDHQIHRGAFSSDGKRFAAGTGSQSGAIKVWDLEKRQEIVAVRQTGGIYRMTFSPDGKRLACVGGTIGIWEIPSGKLERKMQGHSGIILGAAFSPNGKRLISAGSDGLAKIWDVATGEERGNALSVSSPLLEIDFADGGNSLVAVAADERIHFVRAATEQEVDAAR